MEKHKIKEFMSAFNECDPIERATILVKAANTQRDTAAQWRVLEEWYKNCEETLNAIIKEQFDEMAALKKDNDYLTIKVAELEMQQRGAKVQGYSADNATIANVELSNSKAGVFLSELAVEKLKEIAKHGSTLKARINDEGHLFLESSPDTSTPTDAPKNIGEKKAHTYECEFKRMVFLDDAPEKTEERECGTDKGFIDEYHKHQVAFAPTLQRDTKDTYAFVVKDDDLKTKEVLSGILSDITILHNGHIGDINRAFKDGGIDARGHEIALTSATTTFNNFKRLIRISIDVEAAKEAKRCRKCNAPCKPFTALHNPLCGSSEQGSALAPSSEAHLINCLKCTICGHSFVVKE